ncbi:chaplin [Streptomyces lunaelactis]|uniref:Chaplin n=1 Tax=Streptomyces lunaelactis TaxID=1535768 RepID=A0A2R4T7F4_9ACTN|nr:chaplin [Streptomyces lunaelactis]AVZ75027.1 chaplin [Streptomyces lunaelactis]NUK84418.1 chaplin [Streptomyces lunaelactis]NUL04228.1 chaplin [Streptomyces lunaelactis]
MKTAKKAALVLAAAGLAAGATAGSAFADAGADGAASSSPGVGSGNMVVAPVHVPVNATGNTANVIGALNPAFSNGAVND